VNSLDFEEEEEEEEEEYINILITSSSLRPISGNRFPMK